MKLLAAVVAFMLLTCMPAVPPVHAEDRSPVLSRMAESLSAAIADVSGRLVALSEKMTEKIENRSIDHLLVFNELLFVKTIADYEKRMLRMAEMIDPRMFPIFCRLRAGDLKKVREQLDLSMKRVNRHARNILEDMKKSRLDIKGIVEVTELRNTIERLAYILEFSEEVFARCAVD